jgi:hypothetical protein
MLYAKNTSNKFVCKILIGNVYRVGLCIRENPNVISDSRSLTQSLASSINEKRDIATKLKCERLEIQRDMRHERIEERGERREKRKNL